MKLFRLILIFWYLFYLYVNWHHTASQCTVVFVFLMRNNSLFSVDVFCLYILIFFDWLAFGNSMLSYIDTYPHLSEMNSVSVLSLGIFISFLFCLIGLFILKAAFKLVVTSRTRQEFPHKNMHHGDIMVCGCVTHS